MTTAGKAILVTGANRGIGKALVEEALRRDAKRVYAGTRRPTTHPDERVVPLILDVTNSAHIQAAVERVESLDILINNAGIAAYDDLADMAVLDQMLAVNFYGVHNLIQKFLPKLIESKGSIVTNVSQNAFAPFPSVPSYSISKAAVFNLMQSLRAILAPKKISVHSILTGIVDTRMSADIDIEKSSPELVAQRIFDGIEKSEEDIFPDPMSAELADDWRNGSAKKLEHRSAAMYAQLTHQDHS